MRCWIVVVGLTACRFGFDERPTTLDASLDASTDATGRCDPTAPFGAPVAIAELNDATVDDGTLRLMPDELSGYFWSYRGGTGKSQLYLATRPDLATPFMITPVQGLDPTVNNVDPTVSPDGTMLVYRHNGGADDLWFATRTTPDTLTAAAKDATLSSTSSDVQPFWQVGGDELYFSSRRTGGGDLYRATYAGGFQAPALVTELSLSTSEEGDPMISPDGLTIYFRSNRPGLITDPKLFNIWTASRTTVASVFAPPALVPNVNSDKNEGPSWLSLDGCRLYLSSDRAGTNDIYVATRGS